MHYYIMTYSTMDFDSLFFVEGMNAPPSSFIPLTIFLSFSDTSSA